MIDNSIGAFAARAAKGKTNRPPHFTSNCTSSRITATPRRISMRLNSCSCQQSTRWRSIACGERGGLRCALRWPAAATAPLLIPFLLHLCRCSCAPPAFQWRAIIINSLARAASVRQQRQERTLLFLVALRSSLLALVWLLSPSSLCVRPVSLLRFSFRRDVPLHSRRRRRTRRCCQRQRWRIRRRETQLQQRRPILATVIRRRLGCGSSGVWRRSPVLRRRPTLLRRRPSVLWRPPVVRRRALLWRRRRWRRRSVHCFARSVL